MKTPHFYLALVVFAAVTTPLSRAAGPLPAGPPVAISVKAASRLRAAGLDPGTPQFAELLRTRLSAVQHFEPIRQAPLRIALPKTFAAARSGPGLPQSLSSGVRVGNIAATSQLQDAGIPALGAGPFVIPEYTIWVLKSSNPKLPEIDNKSAVVSIDVPACGYSLKLSANVYPWNSGPGIQFAQEQSIPSVANTYYVYWPAQSWTPPQLGATVRSGQMGFQMPGASLAGTRSQTFAPAPVVTDYQVGIGNAPPFLTGSNPMGLAPSNSTFGQASVTRFNGGTADMTGDDILGQGIALGKGYTASAAVVSATSVADVSGNSAPDNGYRGASVTTQPQSGRLETQVHWHIGPGDSLQYVVDYRSRPARNRL
jgi:hypothetical protein